MAPEMRFCTNCGTPLVPGSRFCVDCGNPVEALPGEPPPTPGGQGAAAASPPVATPAAVSAPPAPVAYAPVGSAPVPAKRSRTGCVLLGCAGVAAVVIVGALIAYAAYARGALPGGLAPVPTPTAAPTATATVPATATVVPPTRTPTPLIPTPTRTTPPPTSTSTRTATPTPSATPIAFSKGRQVFAQDFSTRALTWAQNTDAAYKRYIKDGRYVIELLSENSWVWTCPPDAPEMRDSVLEVRLQADAAGDSALVGALFRHTGNENHYVIHFSPGGDWEFTKRVQGKQTVVASGKNVGVGVLMRTGATLRVVAKGSAFAFFLDGVQLATSTDSSLASGKLCVSTESRSSDGVTASFDDVTAWELAP